jgi:hypothetical protein
MPAVVEGSVPAEVCKSTSVQVSVSMSALALVLVLVLVFFDRKLTIQTVSFVSEQVLACRGH